MLSAVAHGRGEQGLEVALAALAASPGLDEQRVLVYGDLVLSALGEAARRAVEKLMSDGTYECRSDFARKYIAKGAAEGKATGILVVLAARGIEVTAEIEETILACQDLDQLDQWIRRAATISSLDELRE